jgi:N-acetylglucosamine kinase-like BadF-type ATPase
VLVLGIDIGGTATRALVTTLDGARVGFGAAGAGNPVTVPAAEAAANIAAALTAALAGVAREDIVSAVAGAAGASRPAPIEKAMSYADIRCPLRVVGDVVIAYAAGADAPHGSVLVSGTGAVAAEIRESAVVRLADGLGWLLGDEGSGFWLGRAAAAATARALYRGDPPSPLTELVTAAVGQSTPDALVAALYDRPPRELAALAPLVTAAARAADTLARGIVERAAALLMATLAQVREPDDPRPIVLAGGALRHCPPLLAEARRLAGAAWPAAPLRLAGPGEVGAARLASRQATAGSPSRLPPPC